MKKVINLNKRTIHVKNEYCLLLYLNIISIKMQIPWNTVLMATR